ncbi:MAG TPA: hypothetical protein V6D07_00795 [Trichocoleus sp.]
MPYRKPHSLSLDLESRLLRLIVLAGTALLLVAIVQILLPWLMLAGLAWLGFWLNQRQRKQQQVLHRLFYEMLKANHGKVSVLDFAIAADLTGPQARAFLDARAREFYANFEPTDHGDILYTFNSPGIQIGERGELEVKGEE